jgi:hypothetical protein
MADELNKIFAALKAANVGNGGRINFRRVSGTSEGASTFHSLWKLGDWPLAGANPPAYTAGSGYIPTKATTGALSNFTNPSAGYKRYPLQCSVRGATAGTLIFYDRVWACSGFVTNSVSVQTITTPGTVNRDANGASLGDGVEIWGEVYTAPGATGATWSVPYKDAANADATATYAHPANAESVGQMLPFVMPSPGCRNPVSFSCSISSGSAGDIGITLMRRICSIDLTLAGVTRVLSALELGMGEIFNDSCIAMAVMCTATNTGLIQGEIVMGNVQD